jgi:outer membrane protein TolC
MRRITILLLSCTLAAGAETRTLTLKQAVALALNQNLDLALAKLDELKASWEVRATKEPLLPRLSVGTGVAYSNGMPMSVDGSLPAIFQAKATRGLWNPQQGYQVAQAREAARGTALGAALQRDEVALRVVSLFLDLERTTEACHVTQRQIEPLERIEAAVRLRVEEGRELPLEARRAELNLARTRHKMQTLETQRITLGRSLALALGLEANVEVAPAREERVAPQLPANEDASVNEALTDNRQIRKLESDLAAKNLEVRSIRAARLPRIDLVAQYAMLSKYNHFEDYYRTFKRNNGQIGASVQIPVFSSSADEARAAQSEIDARRLRLQISNLRHQVEADTRQAWERIHDAESARELAKLDLDVQREQVGVLLSQMEEGRASLRQLEEARFQEQERWLAYYEARTELERSQYALLRETAALVAALR